VFCGLYAAAGAGARVFCGIYAARRRRWGTAGVGGVGTPDTVVGIALVASVVVRAIRHLPGRVLVVGLPDASRARLSERRAVAVAVERR